MKMPKHGRAIGYGWLAGLLLGGMGSWALPAVAAPKPALVPAAGTWQLDILLHGEPQRIELVLPGDDQPKAFWYLLFTVTNHTGRDVDFYPKFELYTDTFKLYQAGTSLQRPVFEAIRQRYQDTIPLLEPLALATGRILQGEDNARDSVVIFPEFDPNARFVKIFLAGLSNETQIIDSPVLTVPATGRPQEILLKKTLMLSYQIPGDIYTPAERVMLYRDRQWLMR
ncbi:MAG: hypothetical protein JW810_13965 [Sedimentisphaerales bacterium]|nr:hypothetical protein [Sedimentisphaerales bacterium]